MKCTRLSVIMQRIHERIRAALESTPHLTQKGLAARMGLNPAAVNRMLHGQRKIMAEEIPVIEEYLGTRLDPEYRQEQKPPRGFSESGRQEPLLPAALPPVPVYRLDGPSLTEKDAADWIPRSPVQLGSRDAFAVFVVSDEMSPRYCKGEIAYIHPGRPAETGRDVLVVPENAPPFLARLVRDGAEKIRVAQFSPAKEKDVSRKNIRAVYAVVGRG